MIRKRDGNHPSSLDETHPRDYSVRLKGLGHQTLRVAKPLRGSKLGPANKGRHYTKTEIEAWQKLFDSYKNST